MTPGVPLAEPQSLEDLATRFGGEVDEDARLRIVMRVVSPRDARDATDLVVVTNTRWVELARNVTGVLLCSERLASRLPKGLRWRHSHAEWALSELLLAFAARDGDTLPVRDAIVSPRAQVASDVAVGAGAVIQSGAVVGSGSRIGENAVVFGGVRIGQRVIVGPLAVIGRPGFGWVEGPDGRTSRMPQLGGVIVEDDAEIGALCTVDAGTLGPTRIGRGAKLDAHVHVGHNVEIGDGTLVAAQSGFAGSVRVGSSVLVGGQAGFKDHVHIGDGARVAAKSGVIGDVPARAVVAGFPAVSRMTWWRAMSKLLEASKKEPK
jgi:UDP-3-O-[3-hydroxymyristoyl] glucosamine N-acyltransferase